VSWGRLRVVVEELDAFWVPACQHYPSGHIHHMEMVDGKLYIVCHATWKRFEVSQ